MKKAIVFTVLLVVVHLVDAQSPTLSAGLSSLTLEKGTLDIALLSEIISNKQDEVKKELIQRYVLETLKDRSFATTNFAYSSLHALLTLKDKEAIQKELLTQIAIFSLQVGFAETFTKLSCEQPSQPFLDFLSLLGLSEGSFKGNSVMYLFSNATERSNKFKYPYSPLLMDIVFESILNNMELRDKGFLKVHPHLISFYDQYSTYRQTKMEPAVEKLKLMVDTTLQLLTEHFNLIGYLANDPGVSIRSLSQNVDSAKIQNELIKALSQKNILLESFQQKESTTPISDELINRIQDVLSGISDFDLRNTSQFDLNMNDYRFMINSVVPLVGETYALGIHDYSDMAWVKKVQRLMFQYLIQKLDKKISATDNLQYLVYTEVIRYAPLIKLITSLDQLDEIGSYKYLFNTIGQIGINTTSKPLKLINDIIYYMEAHTLFDEESKKINVEVESLLLTLLTKYENKNDRVIKAYFSTGLGQTLSINQSGAKELLLDEQGSELQSLGFASEKIGAKWVLFNNRKYRSNLSNAPSDKRASHFATNPIISDVYLIAYGSGLLYNIANLTTEQNFDYGLFGYGLGISSFNALDFNIWVASPQLGGETFRESWNRKLIGFSFDIKLSEYLTELGKKRRASKLN